MAAVAAECGPGRQWWIDDVIHKDEIPFTLTGRQMRCAATRYVDVMGIEEVIRRRLLGAPLLAVAADDETRLDLSNECGVTQSGTLELLVADAGNCLANYGAGPDPADVTTCDQPHNAEVFAVHDLTDDHPTWPGIRSVVETAFALCEASGAAALPTGAGSHDTVVIHPRRRIWEQGDRSVLCLVVHGANGTWTAPSGLVPGATVTTTPPTTAPPTTAAPSGTTLPPRRP